MPAAFQVEATCENFRRRPNSDDFGYGNWTSPGNRTTQYGCWTRFPQVEAEKYYGKRMRLIRLDSARSRPPVIPAYRLVYRDSGLLATAHYRTRGRMTSAQWGEFLRSQRSSLILITPTGDNRCVKPGCEPIDARFFSAARRPLF